MDFLYLCSPMMFSKTIQRYFLWLWLFSVPVATMGIPMYEVYCFCLGKTQMALFVAADPCATHQTTSTANTCCKQASDTCPLGAVMEKPDCCAGKFKARDKHSCTKKTLKVLQFKSKYLVDSLLTLDVDWTVPAPLQSIVFVQPVWIARKPYLPDPPRPPPPLSGRDRCVRHQLYLC